MCEILTDNTKITKKETQNFFNIVENFDKGKIDKDEFLYHSDRYLHSSIFEDISYQVGAYKSLIKLLIKILLSR